MIAGVHWMVGGILRLNSKLTQRTGPDDAHGIRWRVLAVYTFGRGEKQRTVCRLRIINTEKRYPAELVPCDQVIAWIDSGEALFERVKAS